MDVRLYTLFGEAMGGDCIGWRLVTLSDVTHDMSATRMYTMRPRLFAKYSSGHLAEATSRPVAASDLRCRSLAYSPGPECVYDINEAGGTIS